MVYTWSGAKQAASRAATMDSADDMFRQDGDFLEFLMSLPQPLGQSSPDPQASGAEASASDGPSKVRPCAPIRRPLCNFAGCQNACASDTSQNSFALT